MAALGAMPEGEKDAGQRRILVWTLASIGPPAAKKALRDLLNDKS